MTPAIILGLVAVIIILLFLLQRSAEAGRQVALRPLNGLRGLRGQLGRAVESGNPLHVTLGRATLVGESAPTSIAALQLLDELAAEGSLNGTPPLVSVGEGTLLPAAQDSLRHAYQTAGRETGLDPAQVQFLASANNAFVYAGGAANLLQQDHVTGNIAVGQFGTELGLIAEAANNRQIEQVLGTDDPTALAVATAFSPNVLVGEELLAVGAYVAASPGRLASLQLQDIIRWIIAITLILLAIAGLL